MKVQKVGKRIIKTMIAVFLSISVYLVLALIDMARGFKLPISVDETSALCNMYTPFFAGIAAAYALHRDRKSSFAQAKIRSYGSVIGGYFGTNALVFVSHLIQTSTSDIFYIPLFPQYLHCLKFL